MPAAKDRQRKRLIKRACVIGSTILLVALVVAGIVFLGYILWQQHKDRGWEDKLKVPTLLNLHVDGKNSLLNDLNEGQKTTFWDEVCSPPSGYSEDRHRSLLEYWKPTNSNELVSCKYNIDLKNGENPANNYTDCMVCFTNEKSEEFTGCREKYANKKCTENEDWDDYDPVPGEDIGEGNKENCTEEANSNFEKSTLVCDPNARTADSEMALKLGLSAGGIILLIILLIVTLVLAARFCCGRKHSNQDQDELDDFM